MNTPQHAIAGINFDAEADMDDLTETIALRMALDMSRRQESEHWALAEQQRLWEVKERERAKREWAEKEREKIIQEMEREEEAASHRRAVEMALCEREREREQDRMGRDPRARVEKEMRVERQREWERVSKAHARREMEMEAMRARELEETAIAKAVQDSIMSEATRKVMERQDREKRRMGAVIERMRAEEEADAQTERMRRRMQGESGPEWAGGRTKTAGLNRIARPSIPGRAPLGLRDDDFKPSSTQDSARSAPPFATDLYRTYANKNETSGLPLEPTGYDYTPPHTPTPFARRNILDNGIHPPHHWNSNPTPGLIGGTHATGWSNMGPTGLEQWRETTTERWDGVLRRQSGARDAYEGYKEVSKSTRRFL
jgi:hypothetical protein